MENSGLNFLDLRTRQLIASRSLNVSKSLNRYLDSYPDSTLGQLIKEGGLTQSGLESNRTQRFSNNLMGAAFAGKKRPNIELRIELEKLGEQIIAAEKKSNAREFAKETIVNEIGSTPFSSSVTAANADSVEKIGPELSEAIYITSRKCYRLKLEREEKAAKSKKIIKFASAVVLSGLSALGVNKLVNNRHEGTMVDKFPTSENSPTPTILSNSKPTKTPTPNDETIYLETRTPSPLDIATSKWNDITEKYGIKTSQSLNNQPVTVFNSSLIPDTKMFDNEVSLYLQKYDILNGQDRLAINAGSENTGVTNVEILTRTDDGGMVVDISDKVFEVQIKFDPSNKMCTTTFYRSYNSSPEVQSNSTNSNTCFGQTSLRQKIIFGITKDGLKIVPVSKDLSK